MCVKPFKMNRNKSPLDVPTGWSTVTLREMKDRFFLKSHCSHLEFLWLLENHRQGIKDKLVRKANNQDWKKRQKRKWFTQSLINLVIRVSNLKMHMKKVAFWPEYEFHYYRSFQAVLRLHMSLFFLQHLINQKCLAGHIYKYYQSVADFG